MNKLIFVENYVFGDEWFHSIGLKRIDTRTKEARAEALAEGVKLLPQEWPVTLQLYIRSPDDTLRVLNFQSRQGEEGTVDMFLDVLEQLSPPIDAAFPVGSPKQGLPNGYKAFLMEDLQIQEQAKPAKENKNDRREEEQPNEGEGGGNVEGTSEGTPPVGGEDDDGRAGEGDSPRGEGGSDNPQPPRPQDYQPTGTPGPPEGVPNQ